MSTRLHLSVVADLENSAGDVVEVRTEDNFTKNKIASRLVHPQIYRRKEV